MGLLPLTDVLADIVMLRDAEIVPGTFDQITRTEIVQAAGLSTLPMSDIVARHGLVQELPESERHFSTAAS